MRNVHHQRLTAAVVPTARTEPGKEGKRSQAPPIATEPVRVMVHGWHQGGLEVEYTLRVEGGKESSSSATSGGMVVSEGASPAPGLASGEGGQQKRRPRGE